MDALVWSSLANREPCLCLALKASWLLTKPTLSGPESALLPYLCLGVKLHRKTFISKYQRVPKRTTQTQKGSKSTKKYQTNIIT